MSETKVKIFISYSHADKAICEMIAEALGKADGISVWYDKELIVGEIYRNRIAKKIEQSDAFVILLSQNSAKSEWVMDELEYAKKWVDRLVPIWLEDIKLPGGLEMILQRHHGLQWYSRESDGQFINSLAISLLQKNDTDEDDPSGSRVVVRNIPVEKLMLDADFPHSEELRGAIDDFKQSKFDAAFQAFKRLAEGNDPKAQIMLARMYEYGLGTEQNASRADFWFDSAAKQGDVEARYVYGVKLVAAGKKQDKTQWEKGMALLKSSADKKYLKAMKKYIEESCRDLCRFTNRLCALGYCDHVIANCDDPYEKDRYTQAKKELRNQSAKAVGKTVDTAISSIGAVIGMAVCFAGVLYVIAGLLPVLLETNPVFGKLPEVTKDMLLPIEIYWNWIMKYMTVFGAYGLQLIVVGTMIHGTFKNRQIWKLTESIGTFVFFAYVAIIIWYLCAYAKLGGEFSVGDQNQMAYVLLAVLVSVVIGYVVGAIISKLLEAVFPMQKDQK